MEELKDIFVTDRDVLIGGRGMKIKQIQLQDLPKIFDFVNQFLEKSKAAKTNKDLIQVAMQILASEPKHIMNVFSITTSMKPEEINKLSAAGIVAVGKVVLEDNIDFLYKNIMPLLENLGETVKSKTQNGPKKSKGSSNEATL